MPGCRLRQAARWDENEPSVLTVDNSAAYIESNARFAVAPAFFRRHHAVHKRSRTMNPRVFLALASCLVVLGGCRATSAPDSHEPSFTLKEVGPNVWAAISNSKSSAPAPAN